MKKRMIALLVGCVVMVSSVVPVFATPETDIMYANMAHIQRISDYAAYQYNLAAFQTSQIAKGEAQKAALMSDYVTYQANLAAFQKSQVQKGENERAALRADYKAYQDRLTAFQTSQKTKGETKAAARAMLQQVADMVNAY